MRNLILSVAVAITLVATAQEPNTRIQIAVDVKATAAEQLRLSHDLIAKIDSARSAPERQHAIVAALAHLQAVILKWPNDTRAVAAAYDLQYDLAMRSKMPMNAAEIMANAAQLALSTREKAAIYRKQATALAQSGRNAEAAAAFKAAEERQQDATPFERQMFLHDSAQFAARTGPHADAAKRWRALANLPGLEPTTRMTALMTSIDESLRAGDRAGARADYQALQRLYDAAKSRTPAGDADSAFLKIVAAALERHRDD